MMVIKSPQKSPQKAVQETPEPGPRKQRPKPSVAPIFAPKNVAARAAGPSDAIPSSSPAFATPVYPPKPFGINAAIVLPILLPPATLRPLAFRTFTKKHSLTLTSSALQELASFVGRHCGLGWREEGLAEKVLEEVAKSWKNRNGGVIVDGSSAELKDILKTLEGNMSGGKIISGGRGLSRENSILLEPAQDAEHVKTRLGIRPTALLTRDGSQASLGMSGLAVDEEEHDDESGNARSWLRVIGAFEQPRFTYNVGKKHFERDTTRPSLFPPASHKTTAFQNRYNVIHQRLLRNEAFQTSAVADARAVPSLRRTSSSTTQSYKITPIANLLGRHGTHHMLLGMLIILPAGNLAISDPTGAIALDLQQAVAIPEDSAWFGPGMIVLVDGVYEEEDDVTGKGMSGSSGVGGTIGGRLQAFFIGQPPCEKRKVTLGVSDLDGGPDHTIGGGFGWIDFLGVGSERAVGLRMRRLEQRLLRQPTLSDPDVPHRGRMVIIGELDLDQPRSLQALKKILALYAAEPEGASPLVFMLAGNFTTHAVMARGGSGGSIEYKEFFDALASTLAEFPTLLTTATFVFVPGDNDGWASAFGAGAAVPLPRNPVPELFVSRIRRAFATANAEAGLSNTGAGGDGKDGEGNKGGGEAIWTTNPSRLTLFGPSHEVVLFRDDMSARFRRTAVRLKTSSRPGRTSARPGRTSTEEMAGNGSGDIDAVMSGTTLPADEDAGLDENANRDTMDIEEDGGAASSSARNANTTAPPTQKSPSGDDALSHDVRTARKLVKTLLDQGYLAPFRQAVRPVHWDYATALQLYPLPTALVLVDPGAPPFTVTYEGCCVVNPGAVLVAGRRGVGRWAEYDFVGRVGRLRECLF